MDELHQAAAANHGDANGHDAHAHGSDTLGPIDVAAWGAGILGLVVAIVIAAAFVMATSGVG